MKIKKQHLELDMEKLTGSKLGREYIKAVFCYPDYLTYMQSTSCKMPGWMKYKLESRLLGEISIEESEKVGLKLNIQKTQIMASGPITSWEIVGETVSDFIFLGSKITADGDCSHEI